MNRLDIFKEMGSIGSGNAATALSNMLGKKVFLKPIKADIVPIEQIPQDIGSIEQMVMAVYLMIEGDLKGDAAYIHPKENAMKLIAYLTGEECGDTPTDEQISAYKELANIFTASYLTAIAQMLSIHVKPSVPHYASDMLGAIIDEMVAKIGMKVDSVFLIKTEITIEEESLGGGYLMIFHPDSLDKMLKIVEEKIGV